MRDSFGREVDYLRLSVTEGCNLRCVYCRPPQGAEPPAHADGAHACPACANPGVDRLVEIAGAAARLGVRKVRITGGEPCVRADLPQIAAGIAAVGGIEEVCLTTNGTLIAPMAAPLRAAGLARVNLSIDSLDPKRYRAITRGGELAQALAGLEALKAAGFENTKVNCVLMAGVNDDETDAFAAFSAKQGVEVRFIEHMPMGWNVSFPEGNAPPENGAFPSVKETFHLVQIAPISRPFCSTCNRIRVTADGFAKPCLHSADEIDLNGLHGDALVAALGRAIAAKPAGHKLATEGSHAQRGMSRIGG